VRAHLCNALYLQQVDYAKSEARAKVTAKRDKMRRMGRKERKHQIQLDALERELRQTEAVERREDHLKIVGGARVTTFITRHRTL
jgi:hypothetical protein